MFFFYCWGNEWHYSMKRERIGVTVQTWIFLSLYVILQMYGQNRLMDHKWYKFLEKQENWCIVSKESRGRITLPFEVFFFFFFFFHLKKMLACRVVCCLHQSDCCIKVGFESGTSHITAFRYRAPITAFGYWFLLNDVMESEGCAQWH